MFFFYFSFFLVLGKSINFACERLFSLFDEEDVFHCSFSCLGFLEAEVNGGCPLPVGWRC